jgi:hypothetical protein
LAKNPQLPEPVCPPYLSGAEKKIGIIISGLELKTYGRRTSNFGRASDSFLSKIEERAAL